LRGFTNTGRKTAKNKAMKEVIITVRTRMTDEYFNKDAHEMVSDVKSGKFQRELSGVNGITKCTATVQVINSKL